MKTKATKKKTNRTIPPDIKLRLWAVSSARCAFPGCNKELWHEKLTLSGGNFSEMAHIKAVNAGGARHDDENSAELVKDINNLILLCRDHHHLVDSPEHRDEYPVAKLLEFKSTHEERIRLQTSITSNMKTRPVVLLATIGERRPEIFNEEMWRAALDSRYPTDLTGVRIDMTILSEPTTEAEWQKIAEEISTNLNQRLIRGNEQDYAEHLSVFAFAPIPLLMHFGKTLANTRPIDVFQLHRGGSGWKWKDSSEAFVYDTTSPNEGVNTDVALVLSISGKPVYTEITSTLGRSIPVYEISVANPSPLFLDTREKLSGFKTAYRNVLSTIREKHGGNVNIHLFPAVPISIAVACGQELLPKADPAIHVYDLNKSQGGWKKTLKIN